MKQMQIITKPLKPPFLARIVGLLPGQVGSEIIDQQKSLSGMFAELLLGRKKHHGRIFETFQDLREHYGLSLEGQTNNYVAFRRACLSSVFILGFDLAWTLGNTLMGHWSTAFVGLGMSALFAANAARYSFYCYQTRSSRLAPASEWFNRRDAWWPHAWAAPRVVLRSR